MIQAICPLSEEAKVAFLSAPIACKDEVTNSCAVSALQFRIMCQRNAKLSSIHKTECLQGIIASLLDRVSFLEHALALRSDSSDIADLAGDLNADLPTEMECSLTCPRHDMQSDRTACFELHLSDDDVDDGSRVSASHDDDDDLLCAYSSLQLRDAPPSKSESITYASFDKNVAPVEMAAQTDRQLELLVFKAVNDIFVATMPTLMQRVQQRIDQSAFTLESKMDAHRSQLAGLAARVAANGPSVEVDAKAKKRGMP